MPASFVQLGSTVWIAGPASSASTSSLSPNEGDKLLCFVFSNLGNKVFSSVTSGFSVEGGSWTTELENAQALGGDDFGVAVYSCVVAASPGSGTVTATPSGTIKSLGLAVFRVDDADDVFTNSKSGGGETAVSDLTLDSSPASDSVTVAFCVHKTETSPISPSSGWTELLEDNSQEFVYIQYNDSSPGTTIAFDNIGANSSHATIGFEITAAAAGASPTIVNVCVI